MASIEKSLARIGSKTLGAILNGTWQAGQLRLHDGGGLYLKANPTGGGYWSWRYMKAGEEHEIGIGSLGPISAAEARSKAQAFRDQRRRGGDPLAELKAATATANLTARLLAASQQSFDAECGLLIDALAAAGQHAQTLANFRRWREVELQPVLGRMVIDQITTADVAKVVAPMMLEKYSSGVRCRSFIARVIDQARAAGRADQAKANPADKALLAPLVRHIKKPAARNHASMHFDDVPDLCAKLMAMPSRPTAQALLATILSGLRTVEVCRSAWPEIDARDGVWIKPAEHMKMNIEHKVPLSSGLTAVFDRMRPMRDASGFIFPGLKAGTAIDEGSMRKLLQEDLGYDCTVHGFRSSVRTWAGKAGRAPADVAECVLAHRKGGTEGRYHRDAYLDERRPLMEAWAQHCLSKVPPEQRGHLKSVA